MGQHEIGHLGALAVEDLVQEIARYSVALELQPASHATGVGQALDRERRHLEPGRPPLAAPLTRASSSAARCSPEGEEHLGLSLAKASPSSRGSYQLLAGAHAVQSQGGMSGSA